MTEQLMTDEPKDGAESATVRCKFQHISMMGSASTKLSIPIEIHGIPWSINVQKYEEGGTNYLAVFLRGFDNDSIMWSIEVSGVMIVENKDKSMNAVREIKSAMFDHKCRSKGYRKMMKWDELMDEDKGFISDDNITVEIRFTLKNIMGIRRDPSFDFSVSNDPRHDATLVIGGRKLFASKQYLSLHSPVLNALFYGKWTEEKKEEIELKEVEYKDFVEMLKVIYPSGKKITDYTAERLLAVGDYYQIKLVLDQVEQFLISSTTFSVITKLRLSGQYRLVLLQGACLRSFKKISEITSLKNLEEYSKLLENTKLALLEKIMKLSETAVC